ncbi:MAG: PAS domain-containing protein, partial [Candidatus Theseobacter exili]|nr:PAS domain-containing protein [Candidatus Theseobacter exili]
MTYMFIVLLIVIAGLLFCIIRQNKLVIINKKRDADKIFHLSKKTLSTILNCVSEAVITTDSKGFIEYLNPSAQIITEWKNSEAIGQPV